MNAIYLQFVIYKLEKFPRLHANLAKHARLRDCNRLVDARHEVSKTPASTPTPILIYKLTKLLTAGKDGVNGLGEIM